MSDNRYKVRLRDGNLYDPTEGTGPAPSPETVAWGLAGLNRYGAHTFRHLSVAEHSIWIAINLACGGHNNEAFKKAADLLGDGDISGSFKSLPTDNFHVAILGLVHDCPEGCGLVDVPSPITRHEYMEEYKAAHDRCAKWLCESWGIQPPPWPAIIKETDHAVLGAEMVIRPGNHGALGNGEHVDPWPNLDLAGKHDLSRYGTHYVRDAWIYAFYTLQNKLVHVINGTEETVAKRIIAEGIYKGEF